VAFLIASVILAVTPGPGVLYIVTRSLTQGRRFGLASVAGVALGNLGNAVGASIGLAAVFAVSALAFTIVIPRRALSGVPRTWAIRAPRLDREVAKRAPAPLRRICRDGFIVALLNPKTAIFFAAFLPQFMNADSPAIVQSLTLGSVFVAIAAVTDTGYALAAGALAPVLTRARGVRAVGRYLTGGAFIGLGIYSVARD
jgi:threonine/homoserine/homoserine lactone efflux protein